MSSLPPRRNPTPTRISKQHLTPLQTLLQMGFPKHRAEKALAATGNRGVQLASDWLLAHVNDPLLDENLPREYILYACPTGEFLEQLQDFWQKSLTLYGWNGAHNFIPHVTLVSFFKAPDEDALNLSQSLKSVMERQGALLNEPLKLETYASPNFMGFFVAEEHADYLKRIAMQYVKEVSNAIISDTYEHFDALTACFPWCTTTTARCIPRGSRSISLEPHVKSLHLTLAYQFPSNQYANLKSLVDTLDPNLSSDWELRLYSRDHRVNGKQVHKVIHPYVPSESDELELRTGDYVYLSGEALANSPDGWVEGISWLTGLSGLLPESYTQRTAESDAWTLHRKISLNQQSGSLTKKLTKEGKSSEMDQPQLPTWPTQEFLRDYADVREHREENGDVKPRKFFFMRHGERIDFTFGKWIPYCFDDEGNYTRRDMNMPPSLPKRKGGPRDYFRDSPLTNIGMFQAILAGESLKEANVNIEHVYCSPAYRSVQSCDGALKGLGVRDKIKIKLEPGLFEWMEWYKEGPLEFLTPEEYVAAGFNIDLDYKPLVSVEELLSCKGTETMEEFYGRNCNVTKLADEKHESGNVLFVGHSCTLEVTNRQLLGKEPRSLSDLIRVVSKVPYCAIACLQKGIDGKWEMVEPPVAGITHTNNGRFDWKLILE